ncbi:MAG: branched-chain amino acid aminotransferase [Polyangiaceae bacterium]|jgi:branched-chain amino acid aminotransferase|nr:branched-chain amino acid aminotransferase [Polyangiaceae bacterium]MBK8942837.1 branched-chain amino acid aminotransferase [Polyangiaceae bacterium]
MSLSIRTTKTASPRPMPPAEQLGFGKHFSDHMLCVDYDAEHGWHDARVEPYAPLALDPSASVLHYGQAMFEGLKAFRQADGGVAIFRLEAHAKRMERGASRLCMPGLPPEDFMQAIRAFVAVEDAWVPSAPSTALYVRPTLIATEAFLGVRPSNKYLFFIIGSPVGSYYGGDTLKPVRIWVERDYVRAARGGLGATKAGANYAASLYAAVKAKKAGYDQVLWLDAKEHAFVEEVGTMNLFVVIDGTIITPALSDSILAGVTRDSILALAKEWGLKVEERPLGAAEVLDAKKRGKLDEVFGSGTAAVVSPVAELAFGDDRVVINDGKPGPLANRFYHEITSVQRGEKPDTHGWLSRV